MYCVLVALLYREAGLEGRVLYIDLDTVITGSLDGIADYSGPFAALSPAGMANECRSSGINSSVMSWNSLTAPTNGAVHGLLLEAYEVVSTRLNTGVRWGLFVLSYHVLFIFSIFVCTRMRGAIALGAGRDGLNFSLIR